MLLRTIDFVSTFVNIESWMKADKEKKYQSNVDLIASTTTLTRAKILNYLYLSEGPGPLGIENHASKQLL